MIDNASGLIFLANRKTASVSIKVAMRGKGHVKAPEIEPGSCTHDTGPVVSGKYPDIFKSYHKFTVVRNSFNRAHSYFHYHQEKHRYYGKLFEGVEFSDWVLAGCQPPANTRLRKLLDREGCLEDTLDQLCYTDHADTVLSFENLDEEWEAFSLRHGIPFVELTRQNSFSRPPAPWTQAAIDSFSAQYANEIERFGFEAPEVPPILR